MIHPIRRKRCALGNQFLSALLHFSHASLPPPYIGLRWLTAIERFAKPCQPAPNQGDCHHPPKPDRRHVEFKKLHRVPYLRLIDHKPEIDPHLIRLAVRMICSRMDLVPVRLKN